MKQGRASVRKGGIFLVRVLLECRGHLSEIEVQNPYTSFIKHILLSEILVLSQSLSLIPLTDPRIKNPGILCT